MDLNLVLLTKKCRMDPIRPREKKAGQPDRAGYPVERRALVDQFSQIFTLNRKEA